MSKHPIFVPPSNWTFQDIFINGDFAGAATTNPDHWAPQGDTGEEGTGETLCPLLQTFRGNIIEHPSVIQRSKLLDAIAEGRVNYQNVLSHSAWVDFVRRSFINYLVRRGECRSLPGYTLLKPLVVFLAENARAKVQRINLSKIEQRYLASFTTTFYGLLRNLVMHNLDLQKSLSKTATAPFFRVGVPVVWIKDFLNEEPTLEEPPISKSRNKKKRSRPTKPTTSVATTMSAESMSADVLEISEEEDEEDVLHISIEHGDGDDDSDDEEDEDDDYHPSTMHKRRKIRESEEVIISSSTSLSPKRTKSKETSNDEEHHVLPNAPRICQKGPRPLTPPSSSLRVSQKAPRHVDHDDESMRELQYYKKTRDIPSTPSVREHSEDYDDGDQFEIGKETKDIPPSYPTPNAFTSRIMEIGSASSMFFGIFLCHPSEMDDAVGRRTYLSGFKSPRDTFRIKSVNNHWFMETAIPVRNVFVENMSVSTFIFADDQTRGKLKLTLRCQRRDFNNDCTNNFTMELEIPLPRLPRDFEYITDYSREAPKTLLYVPHKDDTMFESVCKDFRYIHPIMRLVCQDERTEEAEELAFAMALARPEQNNDNNNNNKTHPDNEQHHQNQKNVDVEEVIHPYDVSQSQSKMENRIISSSLDTQFNMPPLYTQEPPTPMFPLSLGTTYLNDIDTVCRDQDTLHDDELAVLI